MAGVVGAPRPATTLVWVYGTLKRGFFNHTSTRIHDAAVATYVGTAVTTIRFPLLTLSPYHIPFLLDAPGHGKQVHGEVYAVQPELLTQLDALEGHPHWYVRRPITVSLTDTLQPDACSESVRPRQCEVQAYLLPSTLFKAELLSLPSEAYHDTYRLEDHER